MPDPYDPYAELGGQSLSSYSNQPTDPYNALGGISLSSYSQQQKPMDWPETILRTAPPVIGSVLGGLAGIPALGVGSVGGGMIGGAAGSAVGNLAGNWYSGREFNPAEFGVETISGGLPPILGPAKYAGSVGKYVLSAAARNALEGAAVSAATTPFQHYAQTGSFDAPAEQYISNAKGGAVVGGVLGGTLAGGMHYLQRPRINAGAGAENVDLTPPPDNLKLIGSGSTTPPPPPPTGMHPYVEVSINNPKKQAELEALGYKLVSSDGTTMKFVRKDTLHENPPPEPTTPITETPSTQDPNHISVAQVIKEFGDPVKAVTEGKIEVYNDGTGALGYRRLKPLEPPIREEPPLESYDNEQVGRGETPFTSSKDPLADVAPLQIDEPIISEAEVEAKYRMSVAQAVQEGLVERVEGGYVEIGSITNVRDWSRRTARVPLHGDEAIPEMAFQADEGKTTNREFNEHFIAEGDEFDITNPTTRAEVNNETEIAPEQHIQEIREDFPDIVDQAEAIYREADPKKVSENAARYIAEHEKTYAAFNRAAAEQSRHGIPIPDDLAAAFRRSNALKNLAQAKYERASTRMLQEGADPFTANVLDQPTPDLADLMRRGAIKLGLKPNEFHDYADLRDAVIAKRQQEINATGKDPFNDPTWQHSGQPYEHVPLDRARTPESTAQAVEHIKEAFDALKPTDGRRHVLYDPSGRHTPEELKKFNNSPVVNRVTAQMEVVINKLKETFADRLRTAGSTINKIGYTFENGIGGSNIRKPGSMEHIILVNLHSTLLGADSTPRISANDIVHTIMHEFAHLFSRTEGSEYTAYLKQIYRKFDINHQKEVVDALESILTGPDGRYHPDLQGLLQEYIGSRRRSPTQTNYIAGPKKSQHSAGVGADATTLHSQSIREGTTASVEAPRVGDPPIQPPGNVPPDQVPPGSRPPIPDEPPVSAKKTPWSNKSHWEQAYDFVRNLTTGADISAPMRQGLPLIATKSWWTSWGGMLKAWGSQAAYDANQKSITDHYLFKARELANGKRIAGFGQRMGLRLIDQIDHIEEVTASTLAEKYFPGIKQSNRAYNAFLNKLRADTFTNLIEDAERLGKNPFNDEKLAREIAEFVNTATGAASLKLDVPSFMSRNRQWNFEQSAKQLGYFLFSPRQTFSRGRMMNPLTYMNANPYVRKQYMKAMASSLTAWGTFAGLASMSGYADEVSLDPTSADFMKIRVGKTRLDAGGGFQQYFVALARLLSGQRTTAASAGGPGNTQVLGQGYQARTGLDVAQMFISNKLHPLTKFAYDMLAASEYQPFHVNDKLAQLVVPLYMQDAYEIIREDRPEILPMLFPAAIGMGTQTYEAGEASERMVPKEYDYLYKGGERPWSGMYRR